MFRFIGERIDKPGDFKTGNLITKGSKTFIYNQIFDNGFTEYEVLPETVVLVWGGEGERKCPYNGAECLESSHICNMPNCGV